MVYISTGKELIDPVKLLEEAGLREGMRVADFGCGTLGHYVFPAAQIVGKDGKVYAVDILKSVLSGITSRAKLEGATNVETVWGDLERDRGVRIDDGTLDIGLLINNIFLSRQRSMMLRECVRMIKHGGKLAVVDWKPDGVNFGPLMENSVPVDEAKRIAEAAGLVFGKDLHPGKYHYGFLCDKP